MHIQKFTTGYSDLFEERRLASIPTLGWLSAWRKLSLTALGLSLSSEFSHLPELWLQNGHLIEAIFCVLCVKREYNTYLSSKDKGEYSFSMILSWYLCLTNWSQWTPTGQASWSPKHQTWLIAYSRPAVATSSWAIFGFLLAMRLPGLFG